MSAVTALLTAGFGTLVLVGVPFAIAIAAVTVGAMTFADMEPAFFAQQLIAGSQSFSLLAIPLFMLAGELMTAGGKSGKIPLSHAGRIQELLNHAASSTVAAGAKQLFLKLASVDEIKAAKKPKGLKATLRPYQEQGLSWLRFVHEISSGGVLADDMGLGKTVQTIALLLSLKAEKKTKPLRALIVAPTSVVSNWKHSTLIRSAATAFSSGRHESDITRNSAGSGPAIRCTSSFCRSAGSSSTLRRKSAPGRRCGISLSATSVKTCSSIWRRWSGGSRQQSTGTNARSRSSLW